MPRTLTIFYPDGHKEYWFTDLLLQPGDLLDRPRGSWIVESVSDLNEAGKYTTVVVRAGDSSTTSTPETSRRMRSGTTAPRLRV